MIPITRIALHGYKGIYKTYTPSLATLLTGPNGSGKSACLEAIQYAITGRVPSGRALEIVAQYFPPETGWVEIEDEQGNIRKRGILHQTGRLSEILESTGQGSWDATPISLDIREFLNLSPNLRREALLTLCGAGQAPADLHGLIELAFAKEVMGCVTLDDVIDLGPNSPLPIDVRQVMIGWNKGGGIRDVLKSQVRDSHDDLSELLLTLGKYAHEQLLAARRVRRTETEALETLELRVHGVRAAQGDIDRFRSDEESAARELDKYRQRTTRLDEARKSLRTNEERLSRAEQQVADFFAALERHPKPGPRPELHADLLREIECVRVTLAEHHAEMHDITARRDAYNQGVQEATRAVTCRDQLQMRIEAERRSPIGQLVTLVEKLTANDQHTPVLREISHLVELVAKEWKDRLTVCQVEYEEALVTAARAEEALKQLGQEQPTEAQSSAAIETEKTLHEELLSKERKAIGERTEYETTMRQWTALDGARQEAKQALKAATGSRMTCHAAVEDAHKRLEAIKAANQDMKLDLDDLEVAYYQAKERREKAEEASGMVKAYEEALARREAATVDEHAWKATEQAIKTVREVQVADSTRPLIDALNTFLARSGRPEQAYLELETEHGKPIFELGWTLDGTKTALPALSSGETVLFVTGLAIAVTHKAGGRKMLLIEADPLDRENLQSLLMALLPYAQAFEALIVATAAEGWTAPGWRVIRLGRE